MDKSASMAATDVGPSRLTKPKAGKAHRADEDRRPGHDHQLPAGPPDQSYTGDRKLLRKVT